MLTLLTPTWSSGPLAIARTRRERLLGLRPMPGPFGLLIRCRSVHTFGMWVPIAAIAIDAAGVVLWSGVLPPRRVVAVPRAAWFAETAAGLVPAVGEQVETAPILAGWSAR
ncbi:MAG TPA: hypothetical protein VGB41_06235 [Acidimicrobiia bacterium]